MRKLKLKLGSESNMLTRDEMKKINGGYGDESCIRFDCGSTCPTAPGWCSCVEIEPGRPGICLGG